MLSRRVLYLPNIRSAVKHFRAFSWQSSGQNQEAYKVVGDNNSDSVTIWPDSKLGPFGPQDKRFPFPGTVGTTVRHKARTGPAPPVREYVNPDSLFDQLPVERQGRVLQQAQEEVEYLEETCDGSTAVPTADDMLECVAYECPQIMRKDFADLFPWMDIMHGHFTIVTISQKTHNDMTGWSMDVEAEREKLLASFVQGASDICQELHKAGYWADFIDPSCGKPYLSTEHTNATLYETDERYRKLGFEIDDLGCCKVIRHHIWGTHSYIGCLFTNASTNHPILSMMKRDV